MAFVNNYRDFLFENYRHEHYSDREDLRLSKARILNSAGLPEEHHPIFLNRLNHLIRFIGDCIENMDFPANVNRTRVIVFGDIMILDPKGNKYYPVLEVMNKPPGEKGGGRYIYKGSVFYAIVNKDVMTTLLLADRNWSMKQIEGKATEHSRGTDKESWPIKMIPLNPTNKLIIDLSLSTSEFENSLQCQIIANPSNADDSNDNFRSFKLPNRVPMEMNVDGGKGTLLTFATPKGDIKNSVIGTSEIQDDDKNPGFRKIIMFLDKPDGSKGLKTFRIGDTFIKELGGRENRVGGEGTHYMGKVTSIESSKRDGNLIKFETGQLIDPS